MQHSVLSSIQGPTKCHTAESTGLYPEESLGQLVALGFDVTVFTPAPYQRRRLQRPSVEF